MHVFFIFTLVWELDQIQQLNTPLNENQTTTLSTIDIKSSKDCEKVENSRISSFLKCKPIIGFAWSKKSKKEVFLIQYLIYFWIPVFRKTIKEGIIIKFRKSLYSMKSIFSEFWKCWAEWSGRQTCWGGGCSVDVGTWGPRALLVGTHQSSTFWG